MPFLGDGPVLRVFDPILSENTQKQGVKSENKFCLIKYPSHKEQGFLALRQICPLGISILSGTQHVRERAHYYFFKKPTPCRWSSLVSLLPFPFPVKVQKREIDSTSPVLNLSASRKHAICENLTNIQTCECVLVLVAVPIF